MDVLAEEILGLLIATVVLCCVSLHGKGCAASCTYYTWKCSVVKVRGNAVERSSWAPKIAGKRSQAPYSR